MQLRWKSSRNGPAHQSLLEASVSYYDVSMPRTTLTLEADALKTAREYARRRKLTIGQAVSELVLRASHTELVTEQVGNFHVVRLRADSPKVTAAKVKELEESLS
jgi:predicted DNA-binding ribbon-helix-helix protein